jgi:hypothetical protein
MALGILKYCSKDLTSYFPFHLTFKGADVAQPHVRPAAPICAATPVLHTQPLCRRAMFHWSERSERKRHPFVIWRVSCSTRHLRWPPSKIQGNDVALLLRTSLLSDAD